MAYLLFKYIRRKAQERKATTADDGHLMPDIAPGQENNPIELKNRIENDGNATQPRPSSGTTASGSPLAETSAEENARIAAEASKSWKRRWRLILGLILPNFLAAVDVTIVAPAVPIISSHFSMSAYLTSLPV